MNILTNTRIKLSLVIRTFLWKNWPRWKRLWNLCIPIEGLRSNLFADLTNYEIDGALDSLFPRTVFERIARGVGFCNKKDCEQYRRHKYLYYHEGPFICQTCGQEGWAQPERGVRVGPKGRFFREVRIHYALDVRTREFTKEAVVRDEVLSPEYNTYVYESCYIYTDNSALAAAEQLLNIINQDLSAGDDEFEIPQIREVTFDFDSPRKEFRKQLHAWAREMNGNKFLKEGVVSMSSPGSVPQSRRPSQHGS